MYCRDLIKGILFEDLVDTNWRCFRITYSQVSFMDYYCSQKLHRLQRTRLEIEVGELNEKKSLEKKQLQ